MCNPVTIEGRGTRSRFADRACDPGENRQAIRTRQWKACRDRMAGQGLCCRSMAVLDLGASPRPVSTSLEPRRRQQRRQAGLGLPLVIAQPGYVHWHGGLGWAHAPPKAQTIGTPNDACVCRGHGATFSRTQDVGHPIPTLRVLKKIVRPPGHELVMCVQST